MTRPLSFEALEHRRLLSASVAVRYEFDSPGPVSSLTVGQNFDLKVFVQDVQSVPAGIFQAFFNLAYDPTVMHVTGSAPITNGPMYNAVAPGDASAPGQLKEVGGIATHRILQWPAGAEELLFDVTFQADKAGLINLTPSLSTIPTHKVQFFDLPNFPVALSSISFSGAPISITAGPTVKSILPDPASKSPTNAASVQYDLTFSEPVTGVDASDFVPVQSGGVSSASIANVTPSPTTSSSTYTVTLNTGSGSGTLGLSLINDATIKDSGNLGLTGSFPFVGQVFTIDKTPPVANNDSYSVAENATLTVPAATGVLVNDSDLDSPALNATLVAQPAHGTLTLGALNSNGSFTYVPNPNFSGSDSFSYTASDGLNTSNVATVNITVNFINQAPSFTKGPDQTVNENSPAASIANWASNISAGPPSESSQMLNFLVSNNLNALFLVQPAISPTGTLTFTPASGASGTATVTVQLHDNGGTANGGHDTSATQTFSITVTPVNQAPSFTKGPDQTVNENSPAASIANWASNISAGPPSEFSQMLNFLVSNNLNALFLVQPAISPTGALTFTPASGASGTATVTVQLHDNGGTANGGHDTSATQTFSITVNALTPPVLSVPGAQTTNENVSLLFNTTNGNLISLSDPDVGANSQQVKLTVTNGTLALGTATGVTITAGANGSASLTLAGSLGAVNTALNGLTYKPNNNFSGSDALTVLATDLGPVSAGTQQSASSTVNIAIAPVNQPPVNAVPGPQTVNENQTLAFNATNNNAISVSDPDGGASNEQVQLMVTSGTLALGTTVGVTITAGSNNSSSLTMQGPLLALNTALNGLVYSPMQFFHGSDMLTIATNDLGNTGSGGPLTKTSTVSVTVNFVNQVPSFSKGPDQTVNQNSGTASVANWAGDISAGPPSESSQTLNFNVSNNLNALFSVQPAISPAGTLTFRPANGASGTATVTVQLHDNGGTANGGRDTSPAQTFSITVQAVTPPLLSVPGAQTTNENISLLFNTAKSNLISLSDPDVTANSQQVELTVTSGTLTLGTAAGVTIMAGANGSASLTFTGSVATVNTALNGLTYKPNSNFSGSDALAVLATDLGPVSVGTQQSVSATVNITVMLVNQAPSFTKGPDQTVNENTGAASVAKWATSISAGPPNESGQTLNFMVSNNLATLFSVQPAISPDGTLTFAPASGASGTATVTVKLHDNGGTASGGHDTSAAQTFSITVNALTPPVLSVPGAQTTNENTSLLFNTTKSNLISLSDPDVTANSQQVQLTVTNGTLTLGTAAGVTIAAGANGSASLTFTGSVGAVNAALNGLTYMPNSNFSGSDSLTVVATDQGPVSAGTQQTVSATVNITVNFVNQAPSFTKGPDQTVNENTPAASVAHWAGSISAGPPSESSQTLNFIVSNNLNALFSVQPAISPTGTLTFTPASGASGTATVTIQLHDNGGTANGGHDTSAMQTFSITVTSVNQTPSFTKGPDQTVNENTGAASIANWASSISAGPPSESSQTLNFLVSNNRNSLFLVQPVISRTGTLTFTPASGASGTATVTVQLHDNGGTANGGHDTSAAQTFSITVNAVTPPVLSVPGAQTTDENVSILFNTTNSNLISLNDPDVGINSQQVKLTVTNGTLTLGTVAGVAITAGANGSASLTFTGSVATVNTALNGLTYKPNSNFSGSDALAVVATDLGPISSGATNTMTRTVAITVFPRNGGLSGFVYADINGNGIKDATDPVLAGVTITLTGTESQNHSVNKSTMTFSDGSYQFNKLAPGTYTLAKTQPKSFLDGSPIQGNLGGTPQGHDVISGIQISAASGNGTNYNFSERGPLSNILTLDLFLASTPAGVHLVNGSTNSSASSAVRSVATPAVGIASAATGSAQSLIAHSTSPATIASGLAFPAASPAATSLVSAKSMLASSASSLTNLKASAPLSAVSTSASSTTPQVSNSPKVASTIQPVMDSAAGAQSSTMAAQQVQSNQLGPRQSQNASPQSPGQPASSVGGSAGAAAQPATKPTAIVTSETLKANTSAAASQVVDKALADEDSWTT